MKLVHFHDFQVYFLLFFHTELSTEMFSNETIHAFFFILLRSELITSLYYTIKHLLDKAESIIDKYFR